MAVTGYGAAYLYLMALAVPSVAARVRAALVTGTAAVPAARSRRPVGPAAFGLPPRERGYDRI